MPSDSCPYCGRRRIRLNRGGEFLCWWHPIAGPFGYVRCGKQIEAEFQRDRDLIEMDRL